MTRFAFGGKCGPASPGAAARGGRLPGEGLAEQRGERGAAEHVRPAGEKLAAGFQELGFVEVDHGMGELKPGYLFSTSSRFMSWLQTIVQAASCGGIELGIGLRFADGEQGFRVVGLGSCRTPAGPSELAWTIGFLASCKRAAEHAARR